MKKNILLFAAIIAAANTLTAYAVGSGGVPNQDVGQSIKKNYEKKLSQMEVEEVVIEETVVYQQQVVGKEVQQVPVTVKTPKTVKKPFTPNGTLSFTQTFYGNSGKYKTSTAHPSVSFDYNFAPKWNVTLEWDRLMNMYDYDGGYYQANNNFSSPQGQLNYNYGQLGDTKIDWTTQVGIRQYNYFKSSGNQVWTWINTQFDFHKYLPASDDVKFTQFAIMPMYIYGWYPNSGPDAQGHMNSASISLLTQLQLPWGFSLQTDLFYFHESYTKDFQLSNTAGDSFKDVDYFTFFAWLEYSKELYKFNKDLNLTFNFAGGFDPYTVASEKASGWLPPFWMLSNSYEWLSPTVTASGDTKDTWTVFALPQLELNYTYSEDLSMSLFAQVKYSNQVWGGVEKDWRLQPQGGFSVTYSF